MRGQQRFRWGANQDTTSVLNGSTRNVNRRTLPGMSLPRWITFALLLSFAFPAFAVEAPPANEWQRMDGCRLKPNEWNDGDSFHVQWQNKEFLFRLFAIPFLQKLTKSNVIAVLLPAFSWGFLHTAYPNEPPYIRGLEVGVIGIVAGIVIAWIFR